MIKLVSVSTIEELQTLKLRAGDKVTYICNKCKKEQTQKYINIIKKIDLICAHCIQAEKHHIKSQLKAEKRKAFDLKLKQINDEIKQAHKNYILQQKINKRNAYNLKLKQINEEIKKAHETPYYISNISQLSKVPQYQKIKFKCTTCGTDVVIYAKSFHNRIIKNKLICVKCLNHDGHFLSEVKNRIKETSIKRYGVPVPFMAKENQEKFKDSCRKKYGCENPFQSEEIKKKIKKTNLKKYGAESYNQSPYCHKDKYNSFLRKYTYNNLYFDSSWELAFYIYCIDHNIKISKESKMFTYTHNNKLHCYYPDFSLSCCNIEIKGSHLINENGEWICPYGDDDGKSKAKYECAVQNNVIILTEKDIKPFIKYTKQTYGKNFFNKCKCHNSSFMSSAKFEQLKNKSKLNAQLYKDYKANGGLLSWNEFQKSQ